MTPDPVLEEIRETRESIARARDFDPVKIGEYMLQRQEEFRAAGVTICGDAAAYAAALSAPQDTPDYPYEVSEPDPIIAEIHRIREEMAREANYDPEQLIANIHRCQAERNTQPALVREDPPNPRGDKAAQP